MTSAAAKKTLAKKSAVAIAKSLGAMSDKSLTDTLLKCGGECPVCCESAKARDRPDWHGTTPPRLVMRYGCDACHSAWEETFVFESGSGHRFEEQEADE